VRERAEDREAATRRAGGLELPPPLVEEVALRLG
jgi:hypothetical protein